MKPQISANRMLQVVAFREAQFLLHFHSHFCSDNSCASSVNSYQNLCLLVAYMFAKFALVTFSKKALETKAFRTSI